MALAVFQTTTTGCISPLHSSSSSRKLHSESDSCLRCVVLVHEYSNYCSLTTWTLPGTQRFYPSTGLGVPRYRYATGSVSLSRCCLSLHCFSSIVSAALWTLPHSLLHRSFSSFFREELEVLAVSIKIYKSQFSKWVDWTAWCACETPVHELGY